MDHSLTRVVVKVPSAHFFAWPWWLDQMKKFLADNKLEYFFEDKKVTDTSEDYYITFYFKDKVSASIFAIEWVDRDWGLAHHPV